MIAVVVFCAPVFYLLHLWSNYENIQRDLKHKSSIVVRPVVRDGSARDIGYIYSMRRETNVREGNLNLVWFVIVPATNVRYSCSYEDGYSEFRKGDSVAIIHTKSDEEGDYGFIVGLHDNEVGKVASVWNFDLITAEMDMPEDY